MVKPKKKSLKKMSNNTVKKEIKKEIIEPKKVSLFDYEAYKKAKMGL